MGGKLPPATTRCGRGARPSTANPSGMLLTHHGDGGTLLDTGVPAGRSRSGTAGGQRCPTWATRVTPTRPFPHRGGAKIRRFPPSPPNQSSRLPTDTAGRMG